MVAPESARIALEEGTGAGIRIAILDSGVETGHPDLASVSLADDIAVTSDGIRLHAVPGDGQDLYGHGTAIAGILSRIAPDATLGSFRVLDSQLSSRTAIIREGVRQAMDRGYHVLNCSFGCRGDPRYVMQYKEWVDEAYLRGVHVVAACNNFDVTVPEWPGYFPTVVTVNMARVSGYAFYYSRGQLVEFAAAGEGVEVPWRDGGRKLATGSSYAAPVVAGLLARLLSRHPDLSPIEAKALLHRTAEPFHDRIAASNVIR